MEILTAFLLAVSTVLALGLAIVFVASCDRGYRARLPHLVARLGEWLHLVARRVWPFVLRSRYDELVRQRDKLLVDQLPELPQLRQAIGRDRKHDLRIFNPDDEV